MSKELPESLFVVFVDGVIYVACRQRAMAEEMAESRRLTITKLDAEIVVQTYWRVDGD